MNTKEAARNDLMFAQEIFKRIWAYGNSGVSTDEELLHVMSSIDGYSLKDASIRFYNGVLVLRILAYALGKNLTTYDVWIESSDMQIRNTEMFEDWLDEVEPEAYANGFDSMYEALLAGVPIEDIIV